MNLPFCRSTRTGEGPISGRKKIEKCLIRPKKSKNAFWPVPLPKSTFPVIVGENFDLHACKGFAAYAPARGRGTASRHNW